MMDSSSPERMSATVKIDLSEFVAAVANVEGEMSSDDEEDGSLNEFINAESPKPTSINVDDDEDDTEQIAAIGENDVHMFSPNYEELVATVGADINRAVHVAQSDSGSDATTTMGMAGSPYTSTYGKLR